MCGDGPVCVSVCACVCVCVCVGGVCGGFENFCLLQKPCAAATDRRQRVSSDSVWTERDGYDMRHKETVDGRLSSGFYVLH